MQPIIDAPSSGWKFFGSHIALAWAFANLVSSVSVITLNKSIFERVNLPASLTVLHLGTTAIFGRLGARTVDQDEIVPKEISLSLSERIGFALLANVSFISMNASLLMNDVIIYQVSKSSIIVIVALLQYVIEGTKLRNMQIISLFLLIIGYITTVAEDAIGKVDLVGYFIATLASLSTAFHQTFTRHLQLSRGIPSSDFINLTIVPQMLMLLFISPFMDSLASRHTIKISDFDLHLIILIILSSILAGFLNVTTVNCLQNFTAVSFQVLGYLKTTCIYLMAIVLFGESLSGPKGVGIVIVLLSTIIYSNDIWGRCEGLGEQRQSYIDRQGKKQNDLEKT